jgi:hypothetical protein
MVALRKILRIQAKFLLRAFVYKLCYKDMAHVIYILFPVVTIPYIFTAALSPHFEINAIN